MDNVTHAMFITFSVFALVLGLSFGIYLFNEMNAVVTKLIRATDKTTDYMRISYNSKADKDISGEETISGIVGGNKKTRIVGVDTVMSTLYKYNQESFAVEIYDKSNNLLQVFDLKIEDVINSGMANSKADEHNERMNLYNAYNQLYSSGKPDLFGAPWVGNNEFIKQRIDMFIGAQKGYINSKLVDYSSFKALPKDNINLLFKDKTNKFKEQFIQYTFDGELISASDDEEEEVDSVVGSRKSQSKILIRYTLQ